MEFKLTEREHDALRKLASLGNMYRLLYNEAATLTACGLVESNGDGLAHLTELGRKYLKAIDIELAQSQPGKSGSAVPPRFNFRKR